MKSQKAGGEIEVSFGAEQNNVASLKSHFFNNSATNRS